MRLALLSCVPLLLWIPPAWPQQQLFGALLKTLGGVLLIAGIFGRLWCTLYIGGRKSIELVTAGPYALCRNPLYFFSLCFGVGATLVLGNLWLLLILVSAYLVTHSLTILLEESRLAADFGAAYADYLQRTPRFLPRPAAVVSLLRGTTGNRQLSCDASSLRQAVRDGILYALAFPLSECLELLYRHHLLPLPW